MRRPSPALLVAVAALVVALGGTAVAAKKYVITSTRQISPKVLAQLRGRTGPMGPVGLQGAPGVNGAQGVAGDAGPPGPSNVVSATREERLNFNDNGGIVAQLTSLPAGRWLLLATLSADNPGASTELTCVVDSAPGSSVSVPAATTVQLTTSKTLDLASAKDVALRCNWTSVASVNLHSIRLVAIRTGEVDNRNLG